MWWALDEGKPAAGAARVWVHPSVEAEAREWEEWRGAARARVVYRAGAHIPTRDACEAGPGPFNLST